MRDYTLTVWINVLALTLVFDRLEAQMIRGYARVSTVEQDLTIQIASLKAAGAERIYAEKESGVKTDRKELRRLMKALQPGDILLVARLDRLARSSRDLLNILHEVEQVGAAFRSVADTWCDTTTPHGQLMVTILSGLAQFERSLILARTSAGIAQARKDGVRFGPPPKLTPHQREEALARLAAGEMPRQIAKSYAVHARTISRLTLHAPRA